MTILDYKPSPTAWDFHTSNAFVRGIMGPVGCVRGDTKIITECGPQPISALKGPVRVLSWNAATNQFQLSLSGGAFPKGKDYLYRVVTTQGEFVASGHHLVFCADHNYRPVDTLYPGQSLFQCSDNRLLSKESSCQSLSGLDVGHYSQKDVDYLGSYAELARRYGQQFLQGEGSAPTSPPLQPGAHKLSPHFDQPFGDYKGDPLQPWSKRNHPSLYDGPQYIDGLHYQVEPPPANVEDLDASSPFVHNEVLGLPQQQYQQKTSDHQQVQLSSKCCYSHINSYANGTIISIERLKIKETYWDLQVLDTNNYITEDGTISHNSGKSVACCFEILTRANEQEPNEEAVRKSRCLVVRNTLPQLETTTMKTWKDWFPPGDPDKGRFGRLTGKPPYTHYVTYNLPDGTKVDLEVQFIALDKPDDVKKLLSYECSGIWFNEAREIEYELVSAATARVGRYPGPKDGGCTRKYIIMDTNPPDDSHWWYKFSEEETPKNWEFFRQPSGLSDNAENLENLMQPKNWRDLSIPERRIHGRKYYEDMLGGKTEEWIQVYVRGEYGFIKKGQPVFDREWNSDLHVAKEEIAVNPNGRLYLGVDASGRHPAAVFLQRTYAGQWQVVHELCITDEKGMGAVSFAALLRQEIATNYPTCIIEQVWGDPAGAFKTQTDERTYFDILRAHGIPIREARMALRVPDRLETVKSVLSRMVEGKPALIVSPRCKHLIKGFNGGYQYKKISTAGDIRYADKPSKNRFSDVQDALQYALCGVGEHKAMLQQNKRPTQVTFVPTRLQF